MFTISIAFLLWHAKPLVNEHAAQPLARSHLTSVRSRNVATEWRSPDYDGSRSRDYPADILPPLHVIWSSPRAACWRLVAAAGDCVYSIDTGQIAATSLADGRVLWQHKYDDGYSDGYFADEHGLIYSSQNESVIERLNASDGSIAFRLPGGQTGPLVGLPNGDFMCSVDTWNKPSRLIEGEPATGAVIGQSDICVTTYEPDMYVVPRGLLPMPGPGNKLCVAGYNTTTVLEGGISGKYRAKTYDSDAVAAGNNLIIVLYYPRIEAYDSHLKMLWSTTVPRFGKPTSASHYPVLISSKMVILNDGVYLYALSNRDGRVVWRVLLDPTKPEMGGAPGPSLICGHIIYVIKYSYHVSTSTLMAFRLSDGKPLWSSRVGYNVNSLIANRGYLYGLDSGPSVYPPKGQIFKLASTQH